MNKSGMCKCGCGGVTRIATRNDTKAKQVKGEHLDYLKGHTKYNGGKCTHSKGYAMTKYPQHHRADKRGYVFDHIIIAESMVVHRPITKEECVHHLDGDKKNNNPLNLVVLKNNTEHREKHREITALLKSGNKDMRQCRLCKKFDLPGNMYLNPSSNQFSHRECWKNYYNDNKDRLNELQRIRRAK